MNYRDPETGEYRVGNDAGGSLGIGWRISLAIAGFLALAFTLAGVWLVTNGLSRGAAEFTASLPISTSAAAPTEASVVIDDATEEIGELPAEPVVVTVAPEPTTDEVVATEAPVNTDDTNQVTAQPAPDDVDSDEMTEGGDSSASDQPAAVPVPAPSLLTVGELSLVLPADYLQMPEEPGAEHLDFIGPDYGEADGQIYGGSLRISDSGLRGNSDELQELIDGNCLYEDEGHESVPDDPIRSADVATPVGKMEFSHRTYECPSHIYSYVWWHIEGTFGADYVYFGDRWPRELHEAFQEVATSP